jgi:hypothetical protein
LWLVLVSSTCPLAMVRKRRSAEARAPARGLRAMSAPEWTSAEHVSRYAEIFELLERAGKRLETALLIGVRPDR